MNLSAVHFVDNSEAFVHFKTKRWECMYIGQGEQRGPEEGNAIHFFLIFVQQNGVADRIGVMEMDLRPQDAVEECKSLDGARVEGTLGRELLFAGISDMEYKEVRFA